MQKKPNIVYNKKINIVVYKQATLLNTYMHKSRIFIKVGNVIHFVPYILLMNTQNSLKSTFSLVFVG